MNNKDDNKFRIDNLKRECLYFFLIMVLVGFLVGHLMNRNRLEEDTFPSKSKSCNTILFL